MIMLYGRCIFYGLALLAYVTSQANGLRLHNDLPCDGVLKVDTCTLSLPTNADCSRLNANIKVTHTGMLGLPIWFAIPDIGRFNDTRSIGCKDKSRLYSPLIPGDMSTYNYDTEPSYRLQYAQSYFGLTEKKWGWDCFRHYEILGSGAVPYFEGIEQLQARPKIMYAFPKKLVAEAMALTKSDQIDQEKYCDIHEKLIKFTEENLTTSALTDYVLKHLKSKIGADEPRILFVSTDDVEYGSGFLYHGLFQRFGLRMSSWAGRKKVLFADHKQLEADMYGRGYHYQATLPTPSLYQQCDEKQADQLLQEQMHHRLESGYFNTIIVTTGANQFCTLEDHGAELRQTLNTYLDRFPNTAVASVDGNDLCGCHSSFNEQLKHVDLFFMREADDEDPCTANQARLVQLPEEGIHLSAIHRNTRVDTASLKQEDNFIQKDKDYFTQRISEIHRDLSATDNLHPHLIKRLVNERQALRDRLAQKR